MGGPGLRAPAAAGESGPCGPSESNMTVLMEGIAFGESPRWHDGRLWFSDWGAHQVIALGPDGRPR